MQSSSRSHFARLHCESLESRLTPSARAADAVWNVLGDQQGPHNDSIVISRDLQQPTRLLATVNGTVVGSREIAGLRVVNVHGRQGNDTLSLASNVGHLPRVTFRLFGDAGDDVLQGGRGSDLLDGGAGNDSLEGAGGNDRLLGQAGNDSLYGGSGADFLAGGAGRNRIYGRERGDRLAPGGTNLFYAQPGVNPLDAVHNVSQLRGWVVDQALKQWGGLFGQKATPRWVTWPGAIALDGLGMPVAMPASSPGSQPDHSTTNNQEAGVEEADLVQTDGHYLYTVRGNAFLIIDVSDPAQLAIIGRLEVPQGTTGFYLLGDRVVLISRTYEVEPLEQPDQIVASSPQVGVGLWWPRQIWKPQTVVTTVDVSDRSAPAQIHQTTVDGSLTDSRLVEGRLYAVVENYLDIPQPALIQTSQGTLYESQEEYLARLEAEFVQTLPGFVADGEAGSLVSGAQVYAPRHSTETQLLSVLVFDSSGDHSAPVGVTTTTGTTGTVYVSHDSIYVASTQWSAWSQDAGPTTQIYKFALEGDAAPLEGVGAVPGRLLNQFALDEEAGYLRIATSNGWGNASTNSVFVLRDVGETLEVTGAINNMGLTEQIYAVRFEGDHGYVVTFRRVDPLFTLDLRDPTAPTLVGELKIPGYSSYLQEIAAGLVLGIGRDADENGRVGALQVSLFNVTDFANPQRITVQTFANPGSWSSSVAEYDHHAVAFFAERGLLALPVTTYGIDGASTQVQLLRVGPAGLETLATITQAGLVTRCLRVGDTLLSLSDGELLATSLTDPGVVFGSLELPQQPPWYGGPILIDVLPGVTSPVA
ncbi:MAG: beta-propeller domain-containing protein [Gemmataceae bacterium]